MYPDIFIDLANARGEKAKRNRGGRKKGPKKEIGESFKNKEVKDGWGNIEEKVPTFPPEKS